MIKLTQNPETTAFDIAEAISQDQALASKVLRIANSAYYGFPQKITTINYAIVLLGLNNIRNIVLSTSVIEQLPDTDKTLFDCREFWKHSFLCGIISKKIAEHLGMKTSEEIFMCGLLHDFGKLVLYHFFHEEFVQALSIAKAENISLQEAENRVFNFNHSGVGALLFKKWQLPLSLVKSIEHHHHPDNSFDYFRIASIVHVANYLCRRIGIGSSGDAIIPSLEKKSYKLVNLTSAKIKKMSRQITSEFKQAIEFLDDKEI